MSTRPRIRTADAAHERRVPAAGEAPARGFAIGVALAVTLVHVGAVLLLHTWRGVPIGTLTGDPATIADLPIYTGFLSQAGLFLWFAAAAICLFAASTLPARVGRTETRRFLIASGLLTVMLGLDDAFLLHESLFPRLGVPERVVYLGYASALLAWLVSFRAVITRSDYTLLALALTCFAVSVALDVLEPAGIDRFLFEDGAKFAGIVSWLTYFVTTGKAALAGSGRSGSRVG